MELSRDGEFNTRGELGSISMQSILYLTGERCSDFILVGERNGEYDCVASLTLTVRLLVLLLLLLCSMGCVLLPLL